MQQLGRASEGIASSPMRPNSGAAINTLLQGDANTLQRHWRALVGSALPPGLGRQLVLRILAYKLQTRRMGDLDKASQRELSAALEGDKKQADPAMSAVQLDADASDLNERGVSKARSMRIAIKPTIRPGTMLTREYAGVLHRVMVLDQGVTWNGKTYDSLSQVAFAITGTHWNGPRFFGLRDRPAIVRSSDRSHPSKIAITPSPVGKRRVARIGQVTKERVTS